MHVRQVRKGGQVVGVEDQFVGLAARLHAGAAHQERHADVLLVRAPLFLLYAVLAFMPSVVRGEEDVGLGEHTPVIQPTHDPGHEVVERLQRLGPLFGAIVYLRLFGIAEHRQLPYPGGFV